MRQTLCLIGSMFAWLLVACGGTLAVSAQPQTLTVGSYNVRNFLDVFDDPYSQDESVKVKPRDEIVAMAKAIKKLDADVVLSKSLKTSSSCRRWSMSFA